MKQLFSINDQSRTIQKLAYVPAFVAAISLAVLFFLYEDGVQAALENRSHRMVEASADQIEASLLGDLAAHAMLTQSLAAAIAVQPQMSDAQFRRLASAHFDGSHMLRNVGVAPDMVIRRSYPAKGNEAVIGLDLLSHPTARASVQRLIDTGEVVLSGPLNLIQGGKAVAIRAPVMVADGPTGVQPLWGLVSVVVDLDALINRAGIPGAAGQGLDVALFPAGPDDLNGAEPILGDATILRGMPVLRPVSLHGLDWTLAMRPTAGWVSETQNGWSLLSYLMLTALVVIPLLASGHLYRRNYANLGHLHRREAELKAIDQRYRLALDSNHVGVWDYDIRHDRLFADRRMHDLMGAAGFAHTGMSGWMSNVPEPDRQKLLAGLLRDLERGRHHRATFPVCLPGGDIRHIRLIAAPTQREPLPLDGTAPQRPDHVFGLCWDVTRDVQRERGMARVSDELKRRNRALEAAHKRIAEIAETDPLTGLANRRRFDADTIPETMALRPPTDALLLVDLNGFKEVNDRFGHLLGDQMLVEIAKVLRANSGPDDLVARMGGDEFAILLRGGRRSAAQVENLAARILTEAEQVTTRLAHSHGRGASIGIALPETEPPGRDAATIHDMIAKADFALYRAKERAERKLVIYDQSLENMRDMKRRMASDLRTALEENQFEVFYQPRYDAATMEIRRMEALVRWRHPEKGLLTPSEFIQAAGELKLTGRIDRAVMRQVTRDLDAWAGAGLLMPAITINVSAQRLASHSLMDDLRALGSARRRIELELLEGIDFNAEDGGVLIANARKLRDIGIAYEIDDFGTGHASPVNMLRLRPDGIKLPHQLVSQITRDQDSRSMLAALLAMGHSMGIRVTAEGAETQSHVRILRLMGVDEMQGYALARPLSFDQVCAHEGVRAQFGTGAEEAGKGAYGAPDAEQEGAKQKDIERGAAKPEQPQEEANPDLLNAPSL